MRRVGAGSRVSRILCSCAFNWVVCVWLGAVPALMSPSGVEFSDFRPRGKAQTSLPSPYSRSVRPGSKLAGSASVPEVRRVQNNGKDKQGSPSGAWAAR